MKNLQELYAEIIGSDELKQAFAAAAKEGKVAEFLKAQGCEATAEEIKTFLKEKADQQLSDDELDSVAGGACNNHTLSETLASVFTAGIICAIGTVVSLSEGHVGQMTSEEGRICND